MARIGNNRSEALRLLEEAASYARHTENLQMEAIADELLARAVLEAQDAGSAARFAARARQAYLAWGAAAKVAQLDAKYGRPGAARQLETSLRPAPIASALDMETVLKVARAIAGEIELRNLLPRLMKLAIENAGADRAVFVRDQDGRLVAEAEAFADADRVRLAPQADSAPASFAQSVVWYVRRTGQDVVVGNATTDERFAADPYIAAHPATSILGVPVVHQGKTDGILYLENSLTNDAFTGERTEIMRVLAAQAAIALENARLYEGLKAEIARRSEAERSLRDAVSELEALKNRLEAENVYLQEEIRTQHNFNEIVGNSPALLDALRRVELVAPTESTVLILGETGSGKELFARAVHSRSRRASRPLVKINCGAIAPGLVESELFGHVKGAFTGAIDKRVGRFEVANGGTILLDEVGELPLDAQVKLLRVLQEQEFEPVGSSRTVRVDVRVIAATNRDLDQAVREGRFRADLLYRLNVFPIAVPPLRRRKEDIPAIASLFVSLLARRLGKPLRGFSPRSMERLIAYAWPGNVRELQNVVERAAILATGPVLDVESAFMETAKAPLDEAVETGTLDNVQRRHIQAVLATTGGVVEGAKGAAAILGVHPNTLRSRMRKLGIPPRTAATRTPQA
jgi:formate hydrogenlyase transcriptional activator